MSKHSEYLKREREREEMTDVLNRGVREINRTVQGMDGWADRVMAAILAPLKDNLDKYPLGKNIPHFGQGSKTKI